MKRFNILAVLFIALFAMVMTAPLNAQGMMGDKQQAMQSAKDKDWNDQYSMANKIDENSKTLNQDFQKLQDNFKNTMSMNTVSGVKDGLKKQETMMRNMEPMMSEQKSMSDKLMSMVDKRSKNNMASDSEKVLAKNMYEQTRVMNEDYNSMQKDIKDMMNMNKMSDLQQAMQQHYKSMENMSQMMTGQQDMAGNMTAMMNGNMGSNMMQKNNMGRSGMNNTKTDPPKKDTTKTKSKKW